jgi:hypothetical protein
MTRAELNAAARRRGELDRGSRRISQAVDAQRRLNAWRADSTRIKAVPFGSSDRRHEQVAQAHDQQGPIDAGF